VGEVKSIIGVLMLLGPGVSEVEDGLICLPQEVFNDLNLNPETGGCSREWGSGRRALTVADH
jgi:hypothetical protein